MENVKLKRTLKTKDLVVFGLVFMIPLAPAGMYGTYLGLSGGMVALCYLIGMIAMFFTGMSYRVMSQKFPLAGSVYVYVQKGVSPFLGFLTGWSILLDYFLMPATVVIIGSSFGNALVPSIPVWVWVLSFIAFSTIVNVIGVDFMSKCSWILFVLQLVVIVAFVGCVIRLLLNGTIHFSTISFYNPGHFDISKILQATGIVILSYLGFDAISTMAEETVNPEKSVGRAIILSILIIGLIFIVITFFAGMAYPAYQNLNENTAFIDVVTFVGGKWLTVLTTITLIVSFGIATTQASQAAVARVLFAMARDGALPKQLAYVSKKFQTPIVATLFVALVITPLALLCSLGQIATLVSFGALFGFILLNIAVVNLFFFQNKKKETVTSKYIFQYLICPLLGFVVTLWIFINLSIDAHIVGGLWILAGLFYLLAITKIFTCPVPQIELN